MVSKDQKSFMRDLKEVYIADTKDLAETALLELEEKWGQKYPIVLRSWNNNWERLSTYFDYSAPFDRRNILKTCQNAFSLRKPNLMDFLILK